MSQTFPSETPSEAQALHPDQLFEKFSRLGVKKAVTRWQWEGIHQCGPEDLEWNIMDKLHRPHVHRTYTQALQIAATSKAAITLTTVSLAKIPFMVVIADVQVRQDLYYQCFTLFGLIYFHAVIDTGERRLVTWYIVSPRWLKFSHSFLSRRYLNLTIQQDEEDRPIRERRAQLRTRGYLFSEKKPDFLVSNTLSNNVRPPKLGQNRPISLLGLTEGKLHKVSIGPVEFLVRPNPDQSFTVWPEVCPHEGAPLAQGKICGLQIECLWHGLRFSGAQLSAAESSCLIYNYHFELDGHTLTVTEI